MLHEPQVDLGSTVAAHEAVADEVIYMYIYIRMSICIWISNMHAMIDVPILIPCPCLSPCPHSARGLRLTLAAGSSLDPQHGSCGMCRGEGGGLDRA
jgi:hypothetical protein